jgi:hypothetical protein
MDRARLEPLLASAGLTGVTIGKPLRVSARAMWGNDPVDWYAAADNAYVNANPEWNGGVGAIATSPSAVSTGPGPTLSVVLTGAPAEAGLAVLCSFADNLPAAVDWGDGGSGYGAAEQLPDTGGNAAVWFFVVPSGVSRKQLAVTIYPKNEHGRSNGDFAHCELFLLT